MSDSEANGNLVETGGSVHHGTVVTMATASSAEDLSEYTDADESISAPTEFLAEFLSAVMLKDYETALKYCRLILQYEPNNATAKEFFPLIVEKLQMIDNAPEDSDSDDTSSSDMSEASSSSTSSSNGSSKPSDSEATTASYSSLEDDEADHENNAIGYMNNKFLATDITNGNTTKPTDNRTGGVTRKLVLGRKITVSGAKRSDISPVHLSLASRGYRQDKNIPGITPQVCTTQQDVSPKTSPESPMSEGLSGSYTITSSESESPTDPSTPSTLTTVHELRARIHQ